MGAHARDHIVANRARIPGGRTTSDLDIAIAVPSIASFTAATSDLECHGDTGMGFRIEKVHVDLIPFTRDGSLGPVIEVREGIQMDITGIDEAFTTAEHMPQPHQRLRVPTLHALVVLKTVAWKMRGRGMDKDAQDLALLLRCLDEGDYEERCYGDELADFDGAPIRVGAYVTGRDAGRELPRAPAACGTTWRSRSLADATMARRGTSRDLQDARQLLDDLADGAAAVLG